MKKIFLKKSEQKQKKPLTKFMIYTIINKSANWSLRGVAQLVAHVVWDHGAGSSSLFTPTIIFRVFSSVG